MLLCIQLFRTVSNVTLFEQGNEPCRCINITEYELIKC
jgi:hypothetical protein